LTPIRFPEQGIDDGAVRLRLMTDADVPAVTGACQDPEIARFTTIPSPYEERHAREWLAASRAGLDAGSDLHTLIVTEPGGELAGSVGLSGIDPATGRCAAGYWVAAPARGRGTASRGLALLSRYAFAYLDVHRIEVWIEPGNTASQRVAEAVGFAREGLLRSFMQVGGERRDMLMYSLLPDDLD